MKITVSRIYGPAIKKMVDAGWKIHNNPLRAGTISQAEYRRISGCEMEGEFLTIGDAIRDFEKITGFDVILDCSQDGASVYWFSCSELKVCVGGWECGKYLYEKWPETPRGCLEVMNE